MIIATGSVAKPILGLQFGGRVLGTEEAWALRELPDRLAVIGAGASGTEVASAFGRLGSETFLFEALPQILPLEDKDIARAAAREIGKQQREDRHRREHLVGRRHRRQRDDQVRRRRRETFDYVCIVRRARRRRPRGSASRRPASRPTTAG